MDVPLRALCLIVLGCALYGIFESFYLISFISSEPHTSFRNGITTAQNFSTEISFSPPWKGKRFMLFRTIGNALPPRHHPNQTLENLRFILENEVEDEDLAKHWILFHIVDPSVEKDIATLLDKHRKTYSILPFGMSQYAAQRFRLRDDAGRNLIHRPVSSSEWVRWLTQSEIYEYKNRYTMSVNHARNVMLRLGKEMGGRWILPWDQNCYLTQTGWETMKRDLNTLGEQESRKYFTTWMERITGSNEVLLEKYEPKPQGEPQIIFRNDSVEEFDEEMRYGRRDKVALLVRLSIPGPWDKWGWDSWEKKRTFENISTDTGGLKVGSTAWVARLNSGKSELEKKGNEYQREIKRAMAVKKILDKLDSMALTTVFHFSASGTFMVFDDKYAERNSKQTNVVVELILDHIVSKHEMFQLVGRINNPATPGKEKMDLFLRIIMRVSLLVLGCKVSKNAGFMQEAFDIMQVALIDETSKLDARALALSIWRKESKSNIQHDLDTVLGIVCWLDAMKVMIQTSTFHVSNIPVLLSWLTEFRDSLEGEVLTALGVPHSGLLGVSYDILLGSVSAFIDDKNGFIFSADTSRIRLDGAFNIENLGTNPIATKNNHLEAFTKEIVEWTVMNLISSTIDISQWSVENGSERTLCQAVEKYMPCCGSSCSIDSLSSRDKVLYAWVAKHAQLHCPGLKSDDSCTLLSEATEPKLPMILFFVQNIFK